MGSLNLDEYSRGFRDGWTAHAEETAGDWIDHGKGTRMRLIDSPTPKSPKKRKLSAWNKFVKTNSKKKIYRYANGKVNLKKLGVAYRKTKRGKR